SRSDFSGHSCCGATHLICRSINNDLSLIDHHNMLEEITHLIDQVGGENDGSWILGVILKQPIVEELPGYWVEPQVWLIKEGNGGARGEAKNHTECRLLSTRHLFDGTLEWQFEIRNQAHCILFIPVR